MAFLVIRAKRELQLALPLRRLAYQRGRAEAAQGGLYDWVQAVVHGNLRHCS